MKIIKRIVLALAAVALLAAVAGCDLYQGINLAWNITGMTAIPGGFTRVSYTAQNMGKYDLKGVNLQVGVDITGTRTYPVSAWTADFSVNQNQMVFGSVDVFTGASPVYGATVISVDMNNPGA
jgi:hypothetical protein